VAFLEEYQKHLSAAEQGVDVVDQFVKEQQAQQQEMQVAQTQQEQENWT
jgi:hypothetical protein